jgi:alginate O-acetyltransferase complex protein AlgI
MLFNSYPFLLVFLPAAIALYRTVDGWPRLRIPTLVVLSLAFYGYWNPRFILLLAGSILVNWLAASCYAAGKATAFITAAIIADLAILGLFKYANFFMDSVASLVGASIGHLQLALPLGISFFTFHHVMYLVDLRRGRAETCPLDRYALYICFFPQAIAGPLARWSEVGKQYGREAFAPGWERRCALGATFIIIGLIEKTMLGDPLGRTLDPIYARAIAGPVIDGSAWFALGFAFQIFFDFAGYSDIAIGLGLIFGIELPLNFNAPFRASSILEFWQRWHITLSRFLRDYVFLPLADIRVAGSRHTMAQYAAAIVITMTLCGLWHGAGWNYVLWGTLQGLAIILALGWRMLLPSPPWLMGWAITLAFVLLCGVIFRAGTLEAAWHVFAGLATIPDASKITHPSNLAIGALCAILLPGSRDLCLWLNEKPRALVAVALALAGVAILVQLGSEQSYEFIYFQF